MKTRLQELKAFAEYLSGCTAHPPVGWRRELPGWAWGLWWAFLLTIVALFCGQSSKFIYIDF